MALLKYESEFCQCGCGQRAEDAFNPKQAFMVHKMKCQARWAIEKTRREDREKAERARPDGKLPEGWNDGVRYFAVPAETPAEAQVPRHERARRARQTRERVATG